MKKLIMVYHNNTQTTWVNDLNWENRRKTESIKYGSVEIDTDNVFEVKRLMESDGYHLVKNNPFAVLNNASRMVDELKTK